MPTLADDWPPALQKRTKRRFCAVSHGGHHDLRTLPDRWGASVTACARCGHQPVPKEEARP